MKAEEELEPRAEFSVEVFISGINPELDTEGVETGRTISRLTNLNRNFSNRFNSVIDNIAVKFYSLSRLKPRINSLCNFTLNAGTDNKTYAGIQTVMNEYKSIAEVGEDEATRVKVSGK